ncbi:hypothetical protein BDN67DRAFT_681940 [Paxillus ammoniavirescens]|nr:hypothetical protein BDN67DRAFT_681940 [Paxillus ammoniavirescens]
MIVICAFTTTTLFRIGHPHGNFEQRHSNFQTFFSGLQLPSTSIQSQSSEARGFGTTETVGDRHALRWHCPHDAQVHPGWRAPFISAASTVTREGLSSWRGLNEDSEANWERVLLYSLGRFHSTPLIVIHGVQYFDVLVWTGLRGLTCTAWLCTGA